MGPHLLSNCQTKNLRPSDGHRRNAQSFISIGASLISETHQAPVNTSRGSSELLRLTAAQSALYPIRPIMTGATRIMLMRIIKPISKALKVILSSPFIKFMLGYYHREIPLSTPFLKFFINFFKFFCVKKQIIFLLPKCSLIQTFR